MRDRLRMILYFAVPTVAVLLLLLGATRAQGLWQTFWVSIGSSVAAASVVILLERVIFGDPSAQFDSRFSILTDAAESGLRRVIVDRSSFLGGREICTYVRGSRTVRVHGTALGFLVQNKELLNSLDEVASGGGHVEIMLAHPDSKILALRDLEEGWQNTLRPRIRTSLAELYGLKKKHPANVNLFVFTGEIHNVLISTDHAIILSPYVFGKKGWVCPVFVFSRSNYSVIANFEKQLDEVHAYAETTDPGSLVRVDSNTVFDSLMSVP